jgi:hypothetical protein
MEDSMPATADRIAWLANLDEGLASAARDGQPVLIDFSAAPT